MDKNDKVVAELVQTRISISAQQYKDVYNKFLRPILLAQPGMILAMAGVIALENGQAETQQDGSATVLSLVIWKNVDAHIAFVSGEAAIPFFEAATPTMAAPPSVEHYDIDGLKASSANDKGLLAKLHERHAATEGPETAVISECVEDTSKKTLILFSNSDNFEAAADLTSGNTNIESYKVTWYSRDRKGTD
jgi:heme-degrading monooxygenase HmoA